MRQSQAMEQVTAALLAGVQYGYAGWTAEIDSISGTHPRMRDAIAQWPSSDEYKSHGGTTDMSRHWLGLFDSLVQESIRHYTAAQFCTALESWHKSLTSKQRTMPGKWRAPSYGTASVVAEIAAVCLVIADVYPDAMPGKTAQDKIANYQAYRASLNIERDARKAERQAWAKKAGRYRARRGDKKQVPGTGRKG